MTEMQWRTDGLVPTYTDGETFAWVIDGCVSLETEFGTPIVAWAEFANQRSTTGKRLLATFQVSGPMFEVWRLSEPDAAGHRSASALPWQMVTRYIPFASWPSSDGRRGASPLLFRLWDEAQAQHRAEVEADRRAREADPLIAVVDVLGQVGTDYALDVESGDEAAMARTAEDIRKRIAEIDPEDLAEVLFRVTVAYGSACLSADAD